MKHTKEFDIAIIGGGLVGTSLAAALAHTDLRIALIDARPASSKPTLEDYDERSLALGYGSARIYQALGLWSKIATAATPIQTVHVSEKGRLGVTRLNASDLDSNALGYVVTLRHLGSVLDSSLNHQAGLTRFQGARLQHLEADGEAIEISIATDQGPLSLRAALLAGADGTQSMTRTLLGIEQQDLNYQQHAIIANVTPELPHRNQAFERFTPDGPLALLPLTNNRCALVCTQRPEDAARTMHLSVAAFLRDLNARFGYRLGRFVRTGKRECYPLNLMIPERLTGQRSLLLGNAAHTLHPVAGQGLNLALRDVALLAQLLTQYTDPGSPELLTHYATLRMRDIRATAQYTDGLVRLFTHPSNLLGHLRGAGLILLDRLPPMKRQIARIGMGERRYLYGRLFLGLPTEPLAR